MRVCGDVLRNRDTFFITFGPKHITLLGEATPASGTGIRPLTLLCTSVSISFFYVVSEVLSLVLLSKP